MFIGTELTDILEYLNQLTPETQPKWGKMGAQRMVEHLTDALRIATGKNPQKLEIPEEKIPRYLEFLMSDKPLGQNIAVPFATEEMNAQLRNEELELAIDEFVDEWLYFEEFFATNEGYTSVHPYYGALNYDQWLRLSQKHHTHHFTQFGLIS